MAETLKSLLKELRLLGGVTDVVVTTNQTIGRNGSFLAGKPEDNDYGVSVYFNKDGQNIVMARDAFYPNADNLHSIVLTIAAMRAVVRHGGEERDRHAVARALGRAAHPGARGDSRQDGRGQGCL
jgi:hypothetical protein